MLVSAFYVTDFNYRLVQHNVLAPAALYLYFFDSRRDCYAHEYAAYHHNNYDNDYPDNNNAADRRQVSPVRHAAAWQSQ